MNTDAGIIYLFPGKALASLDLLREDLKESKRWSDKMSHK